MMIDKIRPQTPEPPTIEGVPKIPLRQLIDTERRLALLTLESHLRGTQHAHLGYTWDAEMEMPGGMLSFPVQSYVPISKRRPCVSRRMGKKIVKRLTTMVFGHDRFPTIVVDGDEDAEDFVREIARVAKLRTKMVSARNKGGACGSVAISWGFKDGKPKVTVHSPALIEVLGWHDYDERKPSRVIKVYDFKKEVLKGEKIVTETFWFVRYWDGEVELTWREIPDEYARLATWATWPHVERVEHGLGVCPVIWIQNISDDDDVDGESDFDGQADDLNEIDKLVSATQRGTIGNVDPTLVIHDTKGKNETVTRKGSGAVIYSPKGAKYLELTGTAVETALKLISKLEDGALEEAEVVLLDPDQLSGAGVSAAALRTRYAPMLAKTDLLRDQYGEGIVEVLRAMAEAARRLGDAVVLPPRVIVEREVNEDGERLTKVTLVKRRPGSSSSISLKWPPYFPADWSDRKAGVETTKTATGGQPVLSQRSAVELLASMLDIEDTDKELERLEDEQSTRDDRARSLLGAGAPAAGGENIVPGGEPPETGDDDDTSDGDREEK